MILLIGSLEEPMLDMVLAELERRGSDVFHFASADMPATLGFSLTPEGGYFQDEQGRLPLSRVRSVYHRLGFDDFEAFDDYSDAEAGFVNQECVAALAAMLNNIPALVVNPPEASGSNASKPYQVSLVEPYGFSVPATLVTNEALAFRDFYHAWGGQLIYKSISYQRSIVQAVTPADLERLDTLRTCPVQLQQKIPGYDVRVHIVGRSDYFATRIEADQSDYRYDKQARLTPIQLPDRIAENCFAMAAGLGMHLAGIDLRVTPDGEYFCFEVNPSPAFSWYEKHTGQKITAALCDLLERGKA